MQYKLGIVGISGKLGRLLSKGIDKDKYSLVLTANSSHWQETQVPDAIINISSAAAIEQVVHYCTCKKVALIEGTSGLTDAHYALLKDLSERVPVLRAENFSVLHYLQCQLLKHLIKHIPADLHYQLTVNERHTTTKKDAPSATARKLAKLCSNEGADNVTINYSRCGLPVSDHEIRLTLDNEELVVAHGVQNRAAAVDGIIKAIRWIMTQKAGYWTMEDVYAPGEMILT